MDRKRYDDATSKDTLDDLPDDGTADGDYTEQASDGPSPDGAYDEEDELKDAGPV